MKQKGSFCRLSNKLHNESGAISLEFSLLISFFLVLIFFFLELCRVIFLSAALDLAIAESGRSASFDSTAQAEYRTSFIKNLEANINLWPYLGDSSAIIVEDVLFCANVTQLVNDTCQTGSDAVAKSAKIAIYSIRYDYNAVLSKILFLENFKANMLSRKVTFVQHYGLTQ